MRASGAGCAAAMRARSRGDARGCDAGRVGGSGAPSGLRHLQYPQHPRGPVCLYARAAGSLMRLAAAQAAPWGSVSLTGGGTAPGDAAILARTVSAAGWPSASYRAAASAQERRAAAVSPNSYSAPASSASS